jgi:hypothetical protein
MKARLCLLLVTLAAGICAPVASAQTAGSPPYAVAPNITTIIIGPLTTSTGWTAEIEYQGCGDTDGEGGVVFSKTVGVGETVNHLYSGGPAVCTISSAPSGGQVTLEWGSLLNVNVSLVNPGTPSTGSAPPGCTGLGPEVVTETATGTIQGSIHGQVLGSVNASSAPAKGETISDEAEAQQSCSPDATELDVGFGELVPEQLISADAFGSKRTIDILDLAGDTPANAIFGEFDLELSGRSPLFSFSRSLQSASVKIDSSEARGSLEFHGLAACKGYPDARNGTVTGAVTIDDPILGAVKLNGSNATDASLTGAKKNSGFCNGIGPPQAAVTNSCGKRADRCSISRDRNNVVFVDQSYSGPDRLKSELISFGDGSKPERITLDGLVRHRYKRPGTYKATLKLTVAGRVGTKTTHTTVYITR